ncbi:MAG: DUF1015 domain-containing protein [Polyangiaceae bacterium]
MAEIAPLTPLRYDLSRAPSGLSTLVAPPYDVIGPEERAVLAARDPHNVVKLILPEGEGDAKYDHARVLLEGWKDSGVLVRDNEPAFYRYDQTFVAPGGGTKSITRRGFLALVRLAPFSERIVLPHERTLSGPKMDRLKLFRATKTQLSPGFMLYADPKGELDGPLETGRVVHTWNTPDGIHHVLAKVTARDAMQAVTEKIAGGTLLIADGHHRYETAVGYAAEVDAATGNTQPKAEHRYFMTFLVNGDDPNLVVFPTHRHVHSLPTFDGDAMIAKAKDVFDVRELARGVAADVVSKELAASGARTPSFAAALPDGRTFLLALKKDVDLAKHPTAGQREAVVRKTDVAILHSVLLEHVLGISLEAQAAKTNLWYPQDAPATLAELRGGKGQVLFLMNATPVRDVREVAEAGSVMPQKSTFFYPKVPTGLAIHTLDPSRFVPIVL